MTRQRTSEGRYRQEARPLGYRSFTLNDVATVSAIDTIPAKEVACRHQA